MKKILLIGLLIVGCEKDTVAPDNTGTDFGSNLASDSVDHHSAEIFSIAVIVNFVSLPLISSVKSSSIFFPTMAWPKGEW